MYNMPPEIECAPVLFMVFNRPNETQRVFEAIRAARPKFLYVASDGPRTSVDGENSTVKLVRRIATAVDWECSVSTLFREENLGCKLAVAEALDWFFENEPMGIVLEDDCLPSPEFFPFCSALLDRFKDNDDVWTISGSNFLQGQSVGSGSYYFSKYNHVWGWASWSRAWKKRDLEISFWDDFVNTEDWSLLMADNVERKYWQKLIANVIDKKVDTWDYAWTASAWKHNAIHITAAVNLVSNIGFGAGATHTKRKIKNVSELEHHKIFPISHNNLIKVNKWADQFIFDNVYEGKYYRSNLNFCYLILKKIWGRASIKIISILRIS